MKKKLFVSPKGEHEKHSYHSIAEKHVRKIISPFEQFTRNQTTSGFLLLLMMFSAIFLVNSSFNHYYYTIIQTKFSIAINGQTLHFTLKDLVNDALFVFFFFVLGLEMKREFMAGELASWNRALLVSIMALGGMIFPVVIYYLLNHNQATIAGWAIPIATDTAFAISLLIALSRFVPKQLITIIAALAVIDDVGAVIVIAVFYGQAINWSYLLISSSIVFVLITCNFLGIRHFLVYLSLGVLLWMCIELSGLHSTLAGILVSLTVPARPRIGPNRFISIIDYLNERFKIRKHQHALESQEQLEIIEEIENKAKDAATPLQRWETKFTNPVILFILPLFAFVNSGIPFSIHRVHEVFYSPLGLGIILSLVLGKTMGIFSMAYVMVKTKLSSLPEQTTLNHIFTLSLACGIGFTMSIFIANLSLASTDTNTIARASIIVASFIAASLTIVWAVLSFLLSKDEMIKR